jgi:uncharacterized membrane protein YcaP (DUF421 family)
VSVPFAAMFGDPDITFLFNDWEPVLRVFLMAIAGYVTLLVLLRISGQRTLSQMTSFDLVITVTIGSAFGRVITARQVALVEVVVAFATLILLQWLVANVWGKWPRVRRAVTPTPALLFYDGEVIEDEMRRTHLRESDLLAAVRKDGQGSLEDVQAILLEGNGALAVLTRDAFGDGSAVADVAEIPPRQP